MTHRISMNRLIALWRSFLCRQQSCRRETKHHQHWIWASKRDCMNRLRHNRSSCSSWSLSGPSSNLSVLFSVSILLPEPFSHTREQCRVWYSLSSKLWPNSMRKTSRFWTSCNVSRSSRSSISKFTRILCMKRWDYSKVRLKHCRNSLIRMKTKNGMRSWMTIGREWNFRVCKLLNLTNWMTSREKSKAD